MNQSLSANTLAEYETSVSILPGYEVFFAEASEQTADNSLFMYILYMYIYILL